MLNTSWRWNVLWATSRFDDWVYGQFWIPRRIATAVENLHWRVERWAVSDELEPPPDDTATISVPCKWVKGEPIAWMRFSRTHEDSDICDEGCVIHNRTDHHMRHWTLHWREDRGIFERLCPRHGIGHPDPDQGPYWKDTGQDWLWVHGCCGCCKAGAVEVGEGHPSDWLFGDGDE